MENKNIKTNAVAIVVYKSSPTATERASFARCVKILGNHSLHLVYPSSLDITIYLKICAALKKDLLLSPFEDMYFDSVQSYNMLMLSVDFYKKFSAYEYFLLYQLDAWVFSDLLDSWCEKGYDYIGAPWFVGHDGAKEDAPLHAHAGNGGFSLRRVAAFIAMLQKKVPYAHSLPSSESHDEDEAKQVIVHVSVMSVFKSLPGNEDVFFAEYGPMVDPNFKVASPQEAVAFSFEVNPRVLFAMNGYELPFGCHAFEKYDWDFWKDKIKL